MRVGSSQSIVKVKRLIQEDKDKDPSTISQLLTLKKTQNLCQAVFLVLSTLFCAAVFLTFRLPGGGLRKITLLSTVPLGLGWLISARNELKAEKKVEAFLERKPLNRMLTKKWGRRLSKKKMVKISQLAQEGIDLENTLSKIDILVSGASVIKEAESQLISRELFTEETADFFLELNPLIRKLYFYKKPTAVLINNARKIQYLGSSSEEAINLANKCFREIKGPKWTKKESRFLDLDDFVSLLKLKGLKKYQNSSWAQFELKKKARSSIL